MKFEDSEKKIVLCKKGDDITDLTVIAYGIHFTGESGKGTMIFSQKPPVLTFISMRPVLPSRMSAISIFLSTTDLQCSMVKKTIVEINQCCGSGMFIPDPGS